MAFREVIFDAILRTRRFSRGADQIERDLRDIERQGRQTNESNVAGADESVAANRRQESSLSDLIGRFGQVVATAREYGSAALAGAQQTGTLESRQRALAAQSERLVGTQTAVEQSFRRVEAAARTYDAALRRTNGAGTEAQTLRLASANDRLTTARERHTRALSAEVAATAAVRSAQSALSASGNALGRVMGVLGTIFAKTSSAMDKMPLGHLLLTFPAVVTAGNALIGMLAALVGGLGAVAGAVGPAVGALASLPQALLGATGVIGTFISALSGVGDAVSAGTDAMAAAGTEAVDTAAAQETAARGIVMAERGVRDAYIAAADAKRAAARGIQAANDAIISAERGVADALDSQRDAYRNAIDATAALNDARQQAIYRLQDLKAAVQDEALTQERASLSVMQAKERLAQVLADPGSSDLERMDAELSVKEAEARLKQTQEQAKRTRKEYDEAAKQGISKSDEVVAAREAERDSLDALSDAQYGVAQANKALAEAQRGLADAERDAAQARRSAAEGIADAQYNLAQAHKAADDAATSAGSAQDKYAEAMKGLSPEAQAFVVLLIGMRDEWLKMRDAAAAGLLPGLGAALTTMLKLVPLVSEGLFRFGQAIGDIAQRAANLLTSPLFQKIFGELLDSNVKILNIFGDALINTIDFLVRMMRAAIPLTEWLAKSVRGWTESWKAMASGKAGQKKMTEFFERTKETLKVLGRLFKALWTGMVNTFGGGREAGMNLLRTLTRVTEKWAEWTESTEGKNRIKEYFKSTVKPMKEFGRIIRDVTKWFLKLGENPALPKLLKQMRTELGPALSDLFDSIGTNTAPALISLATAFAELLTAIGPTAAAVLEAVADALTMIVDAIVFGNDNIPYFGTAMKVALGYLVTKKILKFLGVWQLISPTMGKAARAVAKAVGRIIASAAKMAAKVIFWVAKMAAKVIFWTLKMVARVIARFAVMAARAIVSTAKMAAKVVARFIKMAAAAIAETAKMAARVIAKFAVMAAKAIASTVKMVARVIARFAAMATAAILSAARMAVRVAASFAAMAAAAIRSMIAMAAVVVRQMAIMTAAMLTNPFVLLATGLLLAGYLLYKYWDDIQAAMVDAVHWVMKFIKKNWNVVKYLLGPFGLVVDWIIKHWDDIKEKFWTAINWILKWVRKGWEKISFLWEKLQDVWDKISDIWDDIKGKFESVINAIVGFVKRVWAFIEKYLIDPIKDAWEGLKGFWDKIEQGFKDLWEGIKSAARNFKSAMGDIWDGIKNIFATPIEFIVNTILDKWIIGNVNEVLDFLGIDKEIPTVGPVSFARGGVVPGQGNVDSVPAMLMPGEFVVRKKAVAKIGKERLAALSEGRSYRGEKPWEDDTSAGGRPRQNYGIGGWIVDKGKDAYNGTKNLVASGVGKIADLGGGIVDLARSGAAKGLEKIFDGFKSAAAGVIPGSGLPQDFGIGSMSHLMDGILDFVRGEEAAQQSVMKIDPLQALNPDAAQGGVFDYARSILSNYGLPDSEFTALYKLWMGESGWNPTADNPTSSAYGIPQALTQLHGLEGTAYMTDPYTQIRWGLNYIKDRYGTPSNAYAFWLAQNPHYYAKGGAVEERGAAARKKKRIAERLAPGDRKRLAALAPDRFARGGAVTKVPAMLTPGEYVVDRDTASRIGRRTLEGLNRGTFASVKQAFAQGGQVEPLRRKSTPASVRQAFARGPSTPRLSAFRKIKSRKEDAANLLQEPQYLHRGGPVLGMQNGMTGGVPTALRWMLSMGNLTRPWNSGLDGRLSRVGSPSDLRGPATPKVESVKKLVEFVRKAEVEKKIYTKKYTSVKGDTLKDILQQNYGATKDKVLDKFLLLNDFTKIQRDKTTIPGTPGTPSTPGSYGSTTDYGRRVWPVPGRITSTYSGHDGVDINRGSGSDDLGDQIRAAVAGVISYVGTARGYGNAIFEKGPYGELVYGHTSSTSVRAGQAVAAGTPIGKVGSTGNSTAPHLHFGFPGGTTAGALAFLNNAPGYSGPTSGTPGTPGTPDQTKITKTTVPDKSVLKDPKFKLKTGTELKLPDMVKWLGSHGWQSVKQKMRTPETPLLKLVQTALPALAKVKERKSEKLMGQYAQRWDPVGAGLNSLNDLLGLGTPADDNSEPDGRTRRAVMHVLKHTYGREHPDLEYRPWQGFTALENALGAQTATNEQNAEFNGYLETLSGWGLNYLVDDLFSKGAVEGLPIAREAVVQRHLAEQLNEQLRIAQLLTPEDQANLLRLISALATTRSGSLQELSRQMGISDYATVQLVEKAREADRLGGVAPGKLNRLYADIASYRAGTFYANSGGMVPGEGNTDSVPAMLTPGEFVLRKVAVKALGMAHVKKMNEMSHFNSGGFVPGSGNTDTVPAMLTPGEFVLRKAAVKALGLGNVKEMNDMRYYNTGGFVAENSFSLAAQPQLSRPGVIAGSSFASAGAATRTTTITYDVDIHNPVAEPSTFSMTKMLQRQAALRLTASEKRDG